MEIPLFKIYTDKEDVKAIREVIESERNWAIGPKIEEFERKTAQYVGTKYALAFNSGTSALHSLMIAYGFGENDEIIVPSFTFIATCNAPLFVKAKPVFAEIESNHFGLDSERLEEKITKKTKAIIAVHYGGMGCKIKEIKKIAQKHNLILIEDAAESLGATVLNKKVGNFGDSAVFSFCAPKVITTGEGGMVVTNNKKLFEKLKLIRSHGRLEDANYFSSPRFLDYICLGYNFRMSNILAALGISQLKKIEKIIKMRKKNAEYLSEKLKDIKEIVLPKEMPGFRHIFQMFTIMVREGKEKRDGLQGYLNKKGILAKVYFYPVHLTSFYKEKFGYKKGDLPITESISEKVLTLPMYPELSLKEMDYMAKTIKKFFKNEV